MIGVLGFVVLVTGGAMVDAAVASRDRFLAWSGLVLAELGLTACLWGAL